MLERMVISMLDISDFMTWFIAQVVSLFSSIFSTLNNITFLGTSLLKFSLTILIIGGGISILITIAQSNIVNSERSGRIKGRREAREKKKGGN